MCFKDFKGILWPHQARRFRILEDAWRVVYEVFQVKEANLHRSWLFLSPEGRWLPEIIKKLPLTRLINRLSGPLLHQLKKGLVQSDILSWLKGQLEWWRFTTWKERAKKWRLPSPIPKLFWTVKWRWLAVRREWLWKRLKFVRQA